MATATLPGAATPEVFVRKSSGLVRVMSPSSAFVYNVLTMGLIFPWTYLWAPGALPGGQLVWGILLAMLLEIPIALSYVWLSTAFPRTGGDYVFQSRVFGGGIAFTLVFSGFVIWILQWVALSGWLLADLGFAPLFLGLGASLNSRQLVEMAAWFTTPMGSSSPASRMRDRDAHPGLGFVNYVRVQRVMWVASSWPSARCSSCSLRHTRPTCQPSWTLSRPPSAVRPRSRLMPSRRPRRWGGPQSRLQSPRDPPDRPDRLDVAPVGDLLQPAERRDQVAGNFRSQAFIIVGSLVVTGLLLALLAFVLEDAVGSEFLYVAGSGYWSGVSEATLAGSYLWPNILATAIAFNPIVTLSSPPGSSSTATRSSITATSA